MFPPGTVVALLRDVPETTLSLGFRMVVVPTAELIAEADRRAAQKSVSSTGPAARDSHW